MGLGQEVRPVPQFPHWPDGVANITLTFWDPGGH